MPQNLACRAGCGAAVVGVGLLGIVALASVVNGRRTPACHAPTGPRALLFDGLLPSGVAMQGPFDALGGGGAVNAESIPGPPPFDEMTVLQRPLGREASGPGMYRLELWLRVGRAWWVRDLGVGADDELRRDGDQVVVRVSDRAGAHHVVRCRVGSTRIPTCDDHP